MNSAAYALAHAAAVSRAPRPADKLTLPPARAGCAWRRIGRLAASHYGIMTPRPGGRAGGGGRPGGGGPTGEFSPAAPGRRRPLRDMSEPPPYQILTRRS